MIDYFNCTFYLYRGGSFQATWIGYPNTTGLPTIDYRFTDALVDPPSTKQRYIECQCWISGSYVGDVNISIFLTWLENGLLFTFRHVEELVRLPGCFLCYTPSSEAGPIVETPAIANGFVTFGSFNNLAKVKKCFTIAFIVQVSVWILL